MKEHLLALGGPESASERKWCLKTWKVSWMDSFMETDMLGSSPKSCNGVKGACHLSGTLR